MKTKTLLSCFAVLFLFMFQTTTELLAQPSKNKIIPLSDFFRNPEKSSFRLSPDGTKIAFMQPWKTRMNIFVQSVGSTQTTQVTFATERNIQGFFWKNDNKLVYLQDKGGDENFHLFSVDAQGKNPVELTPFEGVRAEIIDDLEDDANVMIIGLNKRTPEIFDAYRIDVNTGNLKMVAENPGNITGWQTDNNGVIRIATTTDGINTSVLYRENEKAPFQTLLSTNFKQSFAPLYFTFDNKNIYATSNIGRDKSVIVEYDLKAKKETKVLFEHPQVDVSSLLRSKKRKVITGVAFTTWKSEYQFFDASREAQQKKLEAQLKGYEVAIVSNNKAEDKALVVTYNDKTYGSYYFYDVATDKLTKLADMSPWLNESELCDMKPISYQSRDGLTINGYLTLPKGVPAKNLPVIVNPHGGPWARDEWGFNPEVQFLANRGYAVLQMNFRGSVGYGRNFWEASFKQWGLKMQDDITDGVNWLINEGIADSKKVAIYGGSYGGYATLAGAAFTPDLYACAIDYVGVSNLFTFMQTIPPYWKPFLDMMYEMVGDPVKDKEMMEKVSPVFHVDKIKCPLFVAQGANDPRVNKAESDQMVEALKKRNIAVTYLVKDNEGHGFSNEENKFEFYSTMEEFLKKHM